MEGSFADPGTFFNAYIGSFLWPILAAVAGIILGTRPTGADVERGFADLELSSPLSRTRYLGVAIAMQIAVLVAMAAAMLAAVLVVGAVESSNFNPINFLLVIGPAVAFGAAIAGVTTLATAITLNRGVSAGLIAGIVIAMYLLNIIALMQPDLSELSRLSIFHYFAPRQIIDGTSFDPGDALVTGGIGVATWLASLWRFRTRELSA